MRYPFRSMRVGETKRKQFTDKRLAKNAQLAAYKIQAIKGWRFDISLRAGLLTVTRLKDKVIPIKADFFDIKYDRHNPRNPVHNLLKCETLRIEFARLSELITLRKQAENIARVNGWYLVITQQKMRLSITRMDTPKYNTKYLSGTAVKKCKYPFSAMLPGSYIYLDCSTLQQREKARQAAYVMACRNGWKFETKAVTGSHNLKVWRIK
jgi:hypothetical protein